MHSCALTAPLPDRPTDELDSPHKCVCVCVVWLIWWLQVQQDDVHVSAAPWGKNDTPDVEGRLGSPQVRTGVSRLTPRRLRVLARFCGAGWLRLTREGTMVVFVCV